MWNDAGWNVQPGMVWLGMIQPGMTHPGRIRDIRPCRLQRDRAGKSLDPVAPCLPRDPAPGWLRRLQGQLTPRVNELGARWRRCFPGSGRSLWIEAGREEEPGIPVPFPHPGRSPDPGVPLALPWDPVGHRGAAGAGLWDLGSGNFGMAFSPSEPLPRPGSGASPESRLEFRGHRWNFVLGRSEPGGGAGISRVPEEPFPGIPGILELPNGPGECGEEKFPQNHGIKGIQAGNAELGLEALGGASTLSL